MELGTAWYEAECCQCGENLLIAPGDAVSVIVGKDQDVDGVLCSQCFKFHGKVTNG